MGDKIIVSIFGRRETILPSACRRREMILPSASMNLVRADAEVNGKKKYSDHMGRLKGLCLIKA